MSAAAASFTIKIKTVKGLTFDVTVTGQTTVEELKQKINTTRHIECSTQRLIYRGRILTSTQTMRDCQVTDGSTLHLIIRKNPANQANDTDTNNAANAANNGASAPPAAAAAANQSFMTRIGMPPWLQNMTGMNMAAAAAGSSGGNPNNMPPNMRRPMVIHRVPLGQTARSNASTNAPRPNNNNNNNNNNGADGEQKSNDDDDVDDTPAVEISKAEFAAEMHDEHDAGLNVLTWKLRRKQLLTWAAGKKLQCYWSPPFECNNGSVWRMTLYPAGMYMPGYQNDCVLFLMLEDLPFGVDGLDVEFAMHFEAFDINFKFRRNFTYQAQLATAGWPRNCLLTQKLNDLPVSKKTVHFSVDVTMHRVLLNNGRTMTNLQYMQWIKGSPRSTFARFGNQKVNGRLFRWKLNKKTFRESQVKQFQQSRVYRFAGFQFYLQIYPKGMAQAGFVQPYLHVVRMPPKVATVELLFAFYLNEVHIGNRHIDVFNGKLGKGWGDLTLPADLIKWDDPELANTDHLTLDCRVNILHVSLNSVAWFNKEVSSQQQQPQQIPSIPIESERKESDDSDLNENEKMFKTWLTETVGLQQYFALFVKNEIRSLQDVSEYIEEKTDLTEIGIKAFAHRAKIWKNIIKLKESKQTNDDGNNQNDTQD